MIDNITQRKISFLYVLSRKNELSFTDALQDIYFNNQNKVLKELFPAIRSDFDYLEKIKGDNRIKLSKYMMAKYSPCLVQKLKDEGIIEHDSKPSKQKKKNVSVFSLVGEKFHTVAKMVNEVEPRIFNAFMTTPYFTRNIEMELEIMECYVKILEPNLSSLRSRARQRLMAEIGRVGSIRHIIGLTKCSPAALLEYLEFKQQHRREFDELTALQPEVTHELELENLLSEDVGDIIEKFKASARFRFISIIVKLDFLKLYKKIKLFFLLDHISEKTFDVSGPVNATIEITMGDLHFPELSPDEIVLSS